MARYKDVLLGAARRQRGDFSPSELDWRRLSMPSFLWSSEGIKTDLPTGDLDHCVAAPADSSGLLGKLCEKRCKY